MNGAIELFRLRMAAANRRFLADRIVEQRNIAVKPEASRVSSMALYWFGWDEDHDGWQRSPPNNAPPELIEQSRLEAEVKTLDDIAALPHHHMDGTEPPQSEARQHIFLASLEDLVNEYADRELLDFDERIKVPRELAQFLAETNGAHDPDFRHSGICPFSPLQYPADDENAMYARLEVLADQDEWGGLGAWSLSVELDIVAGIMTGNAGQWCQLWPEYESNKWSSFYVYGRAVSDGDGPEDDWGWLIVFYHQKTGIEHDLWTFKTIPEFLNWYSSWDDRLDVEDMREATSGDLPLGWD